MSAKNFENRWFYCRDNRHAGPGLEAMAEFRDQSSSVLLYNRVIDQRTEAAGQRFRILVERLRALMQPEARPEMLHRAMEIFETAGYPYLQLQTSARRGQAFASLYHAQAVLRILFHCLAVCNQACIDTRTLEQVLDLPLLPDGFAPTARRISTSSIDSAK